MLSFYKSHFFFFYTSTCTCACTHAHAYVEVSQLNKFANSFGPELSWAEMITERSDPETKTLFMSLANIAQSVTVTVYCRFRLRRRTSSRSNKGTKSLGKNTHEPTRGFLLILRFSLPFTFRNKSQLLEAWTV